MNINFNTPNDWILINKNDYDSLGIIDDNDTKLISAYAVNNEGFLSLVCYYDFSEYTTDYINDFDKSFSESNTFDSETEGPFTLKSIFHGYVDEYNKVVYMNINKISTQEGQSGYTIQTFVEQEQGLINIHCSVTTLNENNPIKSALELDFVKDAINLVL
ncbi:MAG: hypothetical protein IJX17_03205 [Clostridia bacterium]|nr:hypothetical protein [Clostridia bacterium]